LHANRFEFHTELAKKVQHQNIKHSIKKIIDKSVVWEVVWVGIIALARILVPTITSQRS